MKNILNNIDAINLLRIINENQEKKEVADFNNKKIELKNIHQHVFDLLSERTKNVETYVYLLVGLSELPEDPDDLEFYRNELLGIAHQLIHHKDDNFDQNQLRSIIATLNAIDVLNCL